MLRGSFMKNTDIATAVQTLPIIRGARGQRVQSERHLHIAEVSKRGSQNHRVVWQVPGAGGRGRWGVNVSGYKASVKRGEPAPGVCCKTRYLQSTIMYHMLNQSERADFMVSVLTTTISEEKTKLQRKQLKGLKVLPLRRGLDHRGWLGVGIFLISLQYHKFFFFFFFFLHSSFRAWDRTRSTAAIPAPAMTPPNP